MATTPTTTADHTRGSDPATPAQPRRSPSDGAARPGLMTAPQLTWRVIRDRARSGAENMALDHALAAGLGQGQAVLRLYAWERPTVSFGRNEPARGLYSTDEAARLGVDYVRRPTGGRAVLHGAELTYAVVAPTRAWGGLRDAYRLINQALAEALHALGAPVTLAGERATPSVDAGPCFQSPAGGEVTAHGRKLVGSAQCRIEGALLQHGSIILAGDQGLLVRLSEGPDEKSVEEHDPPATLSELVGSVSRDEVAESVARAMRATFDGEWVDGECSREELAAAEKLAADRYGKAEWTWRR